MPNGSKIRRFSTALSGMPSILAISSPSRSVEYTLGDKELDAKVKEVTAQSYAFGAEWLRSVTRTGELPMPAEMLIPIIHALIEGLVFQRLLTPELVPDEVFRATFLMLANGQR
ncbi:MAG: hypothetical protein ACREDR_04530 [Blastocatellia bacterium]